MAGLGRGDGHGLVELGLTELLSRRVERLGVYRTIAREERAAGPPGAYAPRDERDADRELDAGLELIRGRYRLSRVVGGISPAEAARIGEDELLTRLADGCEAVVDECDALLVFGGHGAGPGGLGFDARLAAKLGVPVVLLAGGGAAAPPGRVVERDKAVVKAGAAVRPARTGRTAEEIAAELRAAYTLFSDAGCTVIAAIVNRARPNLALDAGLPVPCYVIPEKPALAAPTVRQVAAAARAAHIQGDDDGLQRDVLGFVFGGATLSVFLEHLTDGALVITPGDRADVLLGAMAADMAGTAQPAGVMLTLGERPSETVRTITAKLAPQIPVLSTAADSFSVASMLSGLEGGITPEDHRKVESALGHFSAHVDAAALAGHIEPTRSERVTSRIFEHLIVQRAVADRRHIVLPEGEDERVQRAADIVLRRGIADVTLLGRPDVIRPRVHALGLDLHDVRVLDPLTSPLRDTFAERYALLREHRGMTPRRARDIMGDPNFFGTMMVHAGVVHGMVSGAAGTTAATILPAFQVIKTAPGTPAASAVVFACLADRVVLFADCGMHAMPGASELADIAICTARTAKLFGVEPRVAMLSYSSGPAGAGGDMERVREATELVRSRAPELPVEGPMRYDTAIDGARAGRDPEGSPVAGRATVLVFPDAEIAASACRAVRGAPGTVAYGPVLQGLRQPVNDLDRDATVGDIVDMVAITAVQAQAVAL